jgi:uncharacterized repeat protein (TIGR03803 family)
MKTIITEPSARVTHAFRILTLLLGLSLLVPAARAAVNYQRLKSFGFDSAQSPRAPLIQGSDGALYGTTYQGGIGYGGTVFKVKKDGSGYSDLHYFSGKGSDGANPQAPLIQGGDGALYGTTVNGGTNNMGTVFSLRTDGSSYSVLLSLSTNGVDGQNPQAALVQGMTALSTARPPVAVATLAGQCLRSTRMGPATGCCTASGVSEATASIRNPRSFKGAMARFTERPGAAAASLTAQSSK